MASSSLVQTRLVVSEAGQSLTVVDFDGEHAMVRDPVSGKLRPSFSQDFALEETDDFDPTLITIGVMYGGGAFDHEFRKQEPFVSLSLATTVPKESVFMVVEFWNEDHREVVVRKIGRVHQRFGLPITSNLPRSLFDRHDPLVWKHRFFANGLELPSTLTNWREVQQWFDRLIPSKVRGLPANTPGPVSLIVPMPVYPRSLIHQAIVGELEINCRVDAVGFISEFEFQNVSHPAFQKSAERHIKYFRFLPRMKDGVPVASRVILPFRFHPLRLEEPNRESFTASPIGD